MWFLKKKYEEQTDKPVVNLNPCWICKNTNVKFSSRPSEYFNYYLEIECEKCHFTFEKRGDNDQAYTPESYKKDWDDFINAWNK